MRTILTFFFATLLSLSVTAQSDTLRLASDIWPPFTNVKGEKAVASDLVNLALRRVGVMAINDIRTFDDLLHDIRDNKYDGSSALWENEDRKEDLLFSAPYLHNQLILIGKKGTDVSAKNLNQLGGKQLGLVGSYAYGEAIRQVEGLQIVEGQSDQENLQRLIDGAIDYMLVDALLVEYLMEYQADEVKKYLQIGQKPLLSKSLHFAIRMDVPDSESIIARFNKEIIRMMMDGTFNKVLELNYIRADVDGDGQLEMILSGNRSGNNAPTTSYNVFSPSSQPAAFGNHSYYIDGKKYNSWDDVPSHYKTPMSAEEASKFKILNFGIKK